VTMSGPMLIVMTVTVDPDTNDMSADYGSVCGTCAQERQGKKRSNKSFHSSIFRRIRLHAPTPASARMTVAIMKSRETAIRSKSYRQIHLCDWAPISDCHRSRIILAVCGATMVLCSGEDLSSDPIGD
jgi:hypothetical protein